MKGDLLNISLLPLSPEQWSQRCLKEERTITMGESFKPLQSKEILLQFLNSRAHGRQGSLEDNWQYLSLAAIRVDRHGPRISLDTSLAL